MSTYHSNDTFRYAGRATTALIKAVAGVLVCSLVTLPLLADSPYDRSNVGHQVVVRAAQEDIADIAAQYGVTVIAEMHGDGYAALVEGPMTAGQMRSLMRTDSRIKDLSVAEIAGLPENAGVELAVEDAQGDILRAGDFTTPCLQQGFGEAVWSGFGDQEMADKVRLHEAHQANGDCGSAIVAILDTGVDPDHPLLAGALLPGYDFILGQQGRASEWDAARTDGLVAAIVEGLVAAIVEGPDIAVLEGQGEILVTTPFGGPILSAAVIADLDGNNAPTSFGHGTMVAGLVRLAAPTARILPLRVFDGTGEARVFDVARAIYYAVDNGADVINMSFSLGENSSELLRAVQYARKNGVVCVAAAGNLGERVVTYPAAYGETLGVASLDRDDQLSEFSNFGSGHVDLAAPGHGVISIYPGGINYGIGTGTSFATPFVSGTVALLVSRYPVRDTSSVHAMLHDVTHSAVPVSGLADEIGHGQLDMLGAVLEAQK